MKTYLFSFDGVLLQDSMLILKALQTKAKPFHFRAISDENLNKLRSMAIPEILQFLRISIPKVAFISHRLKNDLAPYFLQIPPISGITEVLHGLRARGDQLGILTANSLQNTHHWLKQYNLLELFKFVYAESSILWKHKSLKKIIQYQKIASHQMYYVCDHIKEILSAKECGAKSIAVTWGFQFEDILKKYTPDFLVHSPQELLELIKTQT